MSRKQPHTKRTSSLPVIAIDRIRAVARPDQLLGHREGEPSGLHVANSNALLFDLDEHDPILEECMAKQAEQEKLEEEQKRASRMEWMGSSTASETTTTTTVPTNRAIHDKSPAAIDAANSSAAAADKSTTTTTRTRSEEFSEKLSAAIDTSLLQHQNDTSRPGTEPPEKNRVVPVQESPTGAAASDMEMSESDQESPIKRRRTTAAPVDPSPISTLDPSRIPPKPLLVADDDDSIVRELEKHYMAMLDNDIIALEEKELMEKLNVDISAAEEREALEEKQRDSFLASTFSSLVENPSSEAPVDPRPPQMRVFDDAAIALEEKEWMVKLDQDICAVELKEKENAAAGERLSRAGDFAIMADSSSSRREQPSSTVPQAQALLASSDSSSREKSRHVKVSKLLPRYLGGDATQPFITQQLFQDTLVAPFVTASGGAEELSGFTAELSAVPGDDSSWALTVQGRSKAVHSFRDQLKAWVTDHIKAHNYQLLLANGIEFEVEIDKSKSIGALLSEVKYLVVDSKKSNGLLISNKSKEGQLTLALGMQATKCGAAVVQVDGGPCSSITEFKKHMGNDDGKKLILVLRVHQDADLSESLISPRSDLPKRFDDARSISAAPNIPEIAADHSSDVVNNVDSSTMRKDADLESLDSPKSNEKANGQSENGSVSVQGLDDNSSNSIPSSIVTANVTAKQVDYIFFSKKFKDVAELEFKGSGIHLNLALGQMWHQHKERYGVSCSDDCQCVFGLPFLAEDVVLEKIKAESKKPDGKKWTNTSNLDIGDHPVGFIGRFAAKFIPKLQKEYQDENSREILQRLVAMWEIHRRNRNFGLECKESCDCLEGWELAFRRGLTPSEDKAGPGGNDILRSSSDSGPLKRKKAGASGSTSLIAHQTPSIEGSIEGSGVFNLRAQASASSPSLAALEKRREDSSATLVGATPLASGTGDGRLSTTKHSVSSLDNHRWSTSAEESTNHRKQSESGSSSHDAISGMIRGVTREPVHSTTTGPRKEYDVLFDTQQPLGFYCCTENQQQSGVTSCNIYSVNPCGQCSTDPRIQKGTTIRAAVIVIGGGRYPITSFQGIRKYYTRAAAERSNLRVWFVNDHVTASYFRDPSVISNDDWTSTGHWRGKHSVGWAGGARIVGSPSTSPSTGRRIRQVPIQTDSVVVPAVGDGTLGMPDSTGKHSVGRPEGARVSGTSSVSPPTGRRIRQVPTQTDSLVLPGQLGTSLGCGTSGMPDSTPARVSGTDEWAILDTFRSTPVHSQPSGSSLKGSIPTEEAKRTGNVRFADATEQRQFRKESRSYEFLVKSSGKGVLPAAAASRISGSTFDPSSRGTNSRELEVFDCIRRGSFQAMLRLLLDGALAESRPGKGLEQMRDYLKSETSSCDKQYALFPADRQLKSKKTDLDLKYLLLKIYLNAAHIAHFARSLKNWVRFEIVIDRIETRLSPSAEIEGGKNLLSAGVIATYDSTTGEALIALPSKPLSSCISYEDGNVYYMNHNTSITPERALTIDLRNELENGLMPKYLGSFNLPLSRLLGKCSKAGGWCVVEEEASPNRFLLSGKVAIRARRVALEPKYLDKKRLTESQRMKQTIKMVAGFNKEASEVDKSEENSHCTLPPNVTVYGGTSFLHSAVFLEDERLVKTLLDLRADPYAKGIGGQSAVTLAINMADGVVEKAAGEEVLDGSSRTSGSLMEAGIDDWRKARRARVDSVCKLLRDHVHSTADNEKDAETSNVDSLEGDNHDERVDRQVDANIHVASVQDSSIPTPTMLHPSQGKIATSVQPRGRDRDWIFGVDQLIKKASLCRQWLRCGRCENRKCAFYHVKDPPGLDLLATAAREAKGRESVYSADWTDAPSSPCKAFYRPSVSSDNVRWFTAILVRQRRFQHDIFHVAGPPGFRGDDGTYWYRSEAEAKTALKNILIAVTWAEKPKKSVPWREVAPATGEVQTKQSGGQTWHWCGVCRYWSTTHATIARGTIAGHQDFGTTPVEAYGFMNSPRTDSAARSQISSPRGDPVDSGSESFHLGTRKQDLNADNPYELASKRQKVPPPPPRDASQLPELPSRHWLGTPGGKSCSFFNRSDSCKRGRQCHYDHVQEELGPALIKQTQTMDSGSQFSLVPKAKGPEFTEHLHFIKGQGGWVTAGYRNSDLQEYYYAENSKTGVRSPQGIWWYKTEGAARSALQRVIIAATFLREPSLCQPDDSRSRRHESSERR